MIPPVQRIPVVAGLAYVERVRRLPSSFTATLVPEPNNRYLPHAIAVVANGEKVGYVAPEISRQYFESCVAPEGSPPMQCPARRASQTDHEMSGVELLLDFTSIPPVTE